MSGDCLFCKIIQKEVPSEFLLETDGLVAFRDINPVAPIHILLVPKKHIASLAEIEAADQDVLGEIVLAAKRLAEQEGIAAGFRLVVNSGPAAGQTVDHLHFHLLGGRSFSWPPG